MNWTCPFCTQPQAVTSPMFCRRTVELEVRSKYGKVGLRVDAIACANIGCNEVSLVVLFGTANWVASTGGGNTFTVIEETAETFRLRPASYAKTQPDCVPKVLTTDYYEACAIRDLSPKASATLSRRVLQGMIRDFCGISRGTLNKEIGALKEMADAGTAPQGVTDETIEAMHHVRSIGNIGAHMEKDINVVVDVDTGEAQALIELIEMLFADWYVAKAKRVERLAKLKEIADKKEDAKVTAKPKKGDPA